jgi:hypothetical protein
VVAQLHNWLAYASLILVAIVALDAAWRAWRGRPRGPLADRLGAVVLIVLVITGAGGLGILAGGSSPAEALHFLYAILAFASLPVADSLSRGRSPRRQAFATLVAAMIAMVLIVRLFQTG